MSETSEELNLKMLERAVEDFDGRRQAFSRDLKIAVALLLAFQFLIFFRFTRLSEEKLGVDAALGRTQTNHAALTNIHARVEAVADDFEQSAEKILHELDAVPENLRAKIRTLEQDIVAFRKLPAPPTPVTRPDIRVQSDLNTAFSPVQTAPEVANAPFSARPPLAAANAPFQRDPAAEAGARLWQRFAGLTTNELKILHGAPLDDPAFRTLVNRLVVEQIIQPGFETLNTRWRSGLAGSFATARTALAARTNDWTQLEQAGFPREQLTTNLAGIERTLLNHQFQPPASPDWWTTFRGKVEQSQEMHLDAQRTTAGLTDALAVSRRQLAGFKEGLDALLAKTESLQQATQEELLKVQTNAATLQSLLQNYVTPIPFVPFGPREAVLYFPVILAAAYLFFAVRHLRLRSRAAELSDAYARLGVSPEIRALTFAAPEVSGRFRTVIAFLLLAPVVFAAVSAWQLLSNQALRHEAPRFLLVLSGLLLASSCLALLRSLFRGNESPSVIETDLQRRNRRG